MPRGNEKRSEAVKLRQPSKERNEDSRVVPAHRLRGNRVQVANSKIAEIEALVWHDASHRLRASVEDLSLHGAKLRMEAVNGEQSFFPGDRLGRVLLNLNGTPLYSGSALVRRVSEDAGDRILGVELEEEGVDLDVLYRVESRATFSERFHEAEEARFQIGSEFRLWVSELADYLRSVKGFADIEERQLDALDLETRQSILSDYFEEARPAFVSRMLAAESELHELVDGMNEEQHAVHRRHYHQHIYPYLKESVFLRRAMDKPMGYAGDYEMMNMIYRDDPEGNTLFAWLMNAYGVNVRAAQAVRNRRDLLVKVILEAIDSARSERVRIANVGCGPANEIQLLLAERPYLGRKLEIILIDQEPRSIAFCERMLAPLVRKTAVKAHVVRESIRKLIAHPSLQTALGTCDLVYSAGLFDYLDDRAFVQLARTLLSSLGQNGHLVIGNFAIGQPSRWFMEYCSEWFLIHRTPQQLLDLGGAAGAAARSMSVMTEPSGINLFLDVRR